MKYIDVEPYYPSEKEQEVIVTYEGEVGILHLDSLEAWILSDLLRNE